MPRTVEPLDVRVLNGNLFTCSSVSIFVIYVIAVCVYVTVANTRDCL